MNLQRLHPRHWEEGAACFGKDVEQETRPILMRFGIGHLSHTELFYPPRIKETYDEYAAQAKRYCFGPNGRTPCPVRRECLAWAIKTDEQHGIWGGMSHRERNALIRKVAAREKIPLDPEKPQEFPQEAIDAALRFIAAQER